MVSIVLPVFNQPSMTEDCLAAIRANTQDYEIVLVDNGSDPPLYWSDGSLDQGDRLIIRNETNLGFPAAINQGIRASKGDVIVLLNNDVTVTPHWAERLMAVLEDYSIVGPMTNFAAGFQRTTVCAYANEQELNQEAEKRWYTYEKSVVEVNWLIGFCMMFRKSLFDELGEFDESLWPCSGEELDFCLRARSKGHRLGVAFGVYVHHEGSVTFNMMDKERTIEYAKIVDRNHDHVAKRWGKDFWERQRMESDIPKTVEGIRLNLGSGPYPMKGFIGVDISDRFNPDLKCDALDLPYGVGEVAEIYAGHLLEHFYYVDGRKALRYWYSILRPGGLISISVPDMDFIMKEYMEDPTPEKLVEMNNLYIYSYVQPSPHLFAYSADLLEKEMAEAGFVNIKRMAVDHPYFPFPVEWQVGFMGEKP